MNEVLIDEEQARVVDILRQIKKLNQMIAMHDKGSKDTVMSGQYLDMKSRFLIELKKILSNYEIEVLLKDQVG